MPRELSFVKKVVYSSLIVLVLAVIGSGISASRLSPNNLGLELFENAIATGAALVAIILALGPVSGAYLNPVVTAVDTALGRLSLTEAWSYGAAQIGGGLIGAVLANLMGFAVVDVNMRGTGCSGGAFDFFEPLQSLDGYDVIETIARQPWVRDHKVGMMGISYGGISQLFTAQLQPPHLEAISPLSVLDATATTLYPGGILNTGFAVAWAQQRQQEALPAGPNSGQAWAYKQIQSGDTTCAANQVLHGEAADLNAKIAANSVST